MEFIQFNQRLIRSDTIYSVSLNGSDSMGWYVEFAYNYGGGSSTIEPPGKFKTEGEALEALLAIGIKVIEWPGPAGAKA